MEGETRRDAWVVRIEFPSEVVPLFVVRCAGSEFTVEWEPTAPRAPAVDHRDRRLLRFRQGEEVPGQVRDAGTQRGFDAVVDDGEEPDLAAGGVDLLRDRVEIVAGEQGREVDARYRGGVGICVAVTHAGTPQAIMPSSRVRNMMRSSGSSGRSIWP